MSRCELSGKSPVVKNLVSHSNIKTKSKAYPNVQSKKFISEALDQSFSFKVCTRALKNIEHVGGFDKYILKQDDAILSKKALVVKNKIAKKIKFKVN
jgi:large subunit ribosomal protein L28